MKVSTMIMTAVTAAGLAAATPAYGPGLPLVESNKLRRIVYRGNLRARTEELWKIALKHNNTRAWGTPGHWETLDWIESHIPKDYYNVERQYFNISRIVYDDVSVTVDGQAQLPVNGFSGGPNGTVTGELFAIPNLGCEASDYPAAAAGKIALVSRGTCNFGLKNANAVNAGALGIVIYNNQNGTLQPDLGTPDMYNVTKFVTGAFIGQEAGVSLVEKLKAGPLSAIVNSIWHTKVDITANILATTKGGDQNKIITIGAHSDSVAAGPGINDNGSGTIGQIEVAKALTKFSVNNAIRFCWWSAEEDGLLGSAYYTENIDEKEAAKIVMNLNFDMIASPNFMYGVYDGDGSSFESPYASEGSGQIEKTFNDFFKEDGKNSVPTEFDGRSDYDGFLQIGIPAGGIFMGAEGLKTEEEAKLFGGTAGAPYDKCYHLLCDDLMNVSYNAYITGAKAMADSVAKYGRSIEGFPFPRVTPKLTPRRLAEEPMIPRKGKGRHGGCSKTQQM